MGADDYISKPIRPRELVSRIRSVLRRASNRQSVIALSDLLIDTDKGTATRNGQNLYLSALEYKLLLVFLAGLYPFLKSLFREYNTWWFYLIPIILIL